MPLSRHPRHPLGRYRLLRGSALAGTLVVITIAFALTLTLSGISFSHLTFATRWSNTQRARNAADSVIALATARLFAKADLGVTRLAADDVVVTTADGTVARLTFNEANAREYKIPYSTNNVTGEASVKGSVRVVPQTAVHLVGSCTADGATVTMEHVLYVPPFPYAIASSGVVKSDYGLVVAAVKEKTDARSFADIPTSLLLPASLCSNATTLEALSIGADSRVTGDAQSAGGIRLDQRAIVMGQVRQHTDPQKIPRLDVAQQFKNLQEQSGVVEIESSGPSGPITGVARRNGNLEIGGDLALDGAALYVDGNLNVNGGIKGRGAVYVTGKTTVSGASDLSADNVTALLSMGDVTLNGEGKAESAYEGLIYTEGNFTARDVTLIGAFVANGQSKDTNLQGSAMTMNNVTLVSEPEDTELQLEIAPAEGEQQPQEPFEFKDFHRCLYHYPDGRLYMGSTIFWEYPPEVKQLDFYVNGTPQPNGDSNGIALTITFKFPAPTGDVTVPMKDARKTLEANLPSGFPGGQLEDEYLFGGPVDLEAMLDPNAYVPSGSSTGGSGSGGSGGNGSQLVLDLSFNRFLNLNEKLRLMLSRQI